MTTPEQNVSSRLEKRQWCEVSLADSGPYPVVTNLWLYDGEEDGNPHYQEFGLDFLVAHDVGGMQVVRIFNRRMRSYEQLPKHVQREIPTPWHLTPEQNTESEPRS